MSELFFIEIELIYNVVFVSSAWQNHSVCITLIIYYIHSMYIHYTFYIYLYIFIYRENIITKNRFKKLSWRLVQSYIKKLRKPT